MEASNNPVVHLVAYAFPENFAVQDLVSEIGGIPSLVDPRGAIRKDLTPDGFVVAYNFGGLCFVNVDQDTRQQFLKNFRSHQGRPLGDAACPEDFLVEENPLEKPRVEFSRLVIDRLTPQRAEVLALTVAQSSAMAFYEALFFRAHHKVTEMVDYMERHGNVGRGSRSLHKLIAETVAMRSEVIGVLHLLDRPDLIWDDKVMDNLYEDLRSVFDLQERYEALARKLDHIQQTMELLLNVTRQNQFFWLELAIVVMILFEIVMSFVRS